MLASITYPILPKSFAQHKAVKSDKIFRHSHCTKIFLNILLQNSLKSTLERKTRYKLRNDVICFNTHSPMLRTTQCVQHGGRRYVLGINLEYVMGSRLFQGLGQRKCYTTVCSENQKVNSWFYYRTNSVHGSICRVDHFRNSQLDAGTGIFFTTGSIAELYSTR